MKTYGPYSPYRVAQGVVYTAGQIGIVCEALSSGDDLGRVGGLALFGEHFVRTGLAHFARVHIPEVFKRVRTLRMFTLRTLNMRALRDRGEHMFFIRLGLDRIGVEN
jgi:hypothetical protein